MDEERELRMELMRMQIDKASFDMEIERRKLTRQTAAIVVSILALVIGAFAAGAAWMHLLGGR